MQSRHLSIQAFTGDADIGCCWPSFHWRDRPSTRCPSRKKGKESGAGVDRQEQGGLSSLRRLLHSGDTMALWQASRALLILQREVRERLCTSHVPLILFGQSIPSVRRRTLEDRWPRSVSASHERLHAKVVEHRLDELREVVVVFPAPVFPRVAVVEDHRPTVGWRTTERGG